MATSYTNPLGSGRRNSYMAVTASAGLMAAGDPLRFVNGDLTANNMYFASTTAADKWLKFDFGAGNKFAIDEAKFYQQDTTSHGTWQWQGSNDNSSWADIGSTFTLGGSSTQTQTTLGGNTTAYRYYRILGVSGNTSNGPYIYQYEFKIDFVETTGASYVRKYGTGVRTSVITVTTDVTLGGGTISGILNGVWLASDPYFTGEAAAGKYISFDFSEAVILTEAAWSESYPAVAQTQGVWKWQGSSNNSDWTDIGNSFTLGSETGNTQLHTELNGNTTAYRYYRLLGVSGNLSIWPIVYEIDFKTDVISSVPLSEDIGDSLNNYSDLAELYYELLSIIAAEDGNNLLDSIDSIYSYYTKVSDDCNNLSDGDTVALLGIPIEITNSIDNWLDYLYYVYNIWWVNLTVTVADDIGAKGPGNKNKYGWKDAIQYQFEAADIIGLFISIDDLEAQFEDDVDILLAQWIGEETVAIGDQMWDSMMYGLADALEIKAVVPRSFSDNMVLGDNVTVSMPAISLPEDSLSLSDVISLILNIGLSSDDDIANLTDEAGSNFPDITSKFAGDTFSMSDFAAVPTLNTPATSYLRRYLNDVKD